MWLTSVVWDILSRVSSEWKQVLPSSSITALWANILRCTRLNSSISCLYRKTSTTINVCITRLLSCRILVHYLVSSWWLSKYLGPNLYNYTSITSEWNDKEKKKKFSLDVQYTNVTLYLFTAIWLLPGGSGYSTCKQNMKLVTTKFKSGGLREKHVVATWNVGNRLSVCL